MDSGMSRDSSESDRIDYNTELMVNILCNSHNGLKVFHFNARSLSGTKLDYVKHVFGSKVADVVCVSESWFNADLPDFMFAIDGYTLFRNDRIGKRGGGVAIYCKNCLSAKLVCMSSDCPVEYLCVELVVSAKVLISCVYNPHRSNALSPFFNEINSRLVEYDYFVVCGDFNVNILNSDCVTSSFLDLVNSSCLKIVNKTSPTRFSNGVQPSLLDLFLVSDLNYVVKHDQLPFVSDHELLFCCFDIVIDRAEKPLNLVLYDYKNIDIDALYSDLCNINWSDCWMLISADDKLEWLMSVIIKLFEFHVPQKVVKPRNNATPWFNEEISDSMKLRNRLRSKWKVSRSAATWSAFVRARNNTNRLIRSAKCKYFSNKLNSALPTKELWKNVRSLNVFGKTNSPCLLEPDILNRHFGSVPAFNIQVPLRDIVDHNSFFEFSNVNEADVITHALSITSNAIGFDGIPLRFIKLILPYIIPTLTHIINHCITTSTFPCLWKVATITPIPKKNNAQLPEDFRPISILPAIAKIFEKIIAEQINGHIDSNGLLSSLQSGFRAGHSCTTALLGILDDIRPQYDSNSLTLLGLLDFSKAFDLGNHELLCHKLQHYFLFGNAAQKLIASYLSNRWQRVCVADKFSELTAVRTGVPQGSTLGPLLFAMYINDLFKLKTHSKMHAYADDVQLYLSRDFNDREVLASLLTEDMNLVNSWASDNGLFLNASKCVVLPIYFKCVTIDLMPNVCINNESLKTVTRAKCLGIVLNSKMSCTDHINSVLQKIYATLRCLRQSSLFTPIETKRKLIIHLIMPHILYFSVVYSSLDSDSRRKICVAFNDAVRYVYGIRRFEHINSFDKKILGVGIVQYLEIRNLLFLHKLLHSKVPPNLFRKLIACRSFRTAQLIIPRFKHLNSGRLFFINAIRIWNLLPVALRFIAGRSDFKKSLYLHYSSPSPST